MNPGAVYHITQLFSTRIQSENHGQNLKHHLFPTPMYTFSFTINKATFYYFQQILSSTLDHAIETANSLKKATERMVQAVSEDLAKVKRKRF